MARDRHITLENRNILREVTKCCYCGSPFRLHIDHIIPVRLGGSNELYNLTRACRYCNLWKGALTVEEFKEKCIKMREQVFSKAMRYILYLRRIKRSNMKELEKQVLIVQIRHHRIWHRLLTNAINSINNKSYQIFHSNA